MDFAVKTSLGILLLLVWISADLGKSNINIDEQCQALKCNSSTEICRTKPKCDDTSKCIYCALKEDSNQQIVSKTLLASSISQQQQQQPLAPRLLAKSGGKKLLADNHPSSIGEVQSTNRTTTTDESSYDDYYVYDEDETSDKNEFGEEDEYLDDYAESSDSFIKGTTPIRKLGICPKVLATNDKCDPTKINQSDCRFDTDCPGEHKCCEATCGNRICHAPITTSVSVCPSSFTCTLNCRLGYRTDSNGCLLCECQSCPSMDQCTKNCPSGYLKDLFSCDMCECSDQCPPFSCGLVCPADVGFAKSPDGCPLCQCATTKSKPTEYTSSCQDDVHCPPGFRCLNDARNVPMCQAVSEPVGPPLPTEKCPNNLPTTCNLQCVNGNYVLDENECPTCACVSDQAIERIDRPPNSCPLLKCRATCGSAGYKTDEKGCGTCECALKSSTIECPRSMCRMYCVNGFRRNENGCEICKCNDSPQPCPELNCANKCLNSYRKDYSGCPTCSCNDEEPKEILDTGCSPMKCSLDCPYGFERDQSGCEICSCNRCPLYTCRMFCMYGFKKNNDGCDVCECDWTPVAEKIQCSERVPCQGNRVCNLNLKQCELVSAEKVNWFIYNFNLKSNIFANEKVPEIFKRDLITNIASKYDLEITQITVSSVESDGMTSFQIMPFYAENLDDFQKKMDQIDTDLNSHEFRLVLPSVARVIEKHMSASVGSKFNRYMRDNPRFVLYLAAILLGLVALVFAGIFMLIFRRRIKHPSRSESKSPIYDTSYHQAPTEDDHYHAVHAPDGTAYVVVETDDIQSSDKRALV